MGTLRNDMDVHLLIESHSLLSACFWRVVLNRGFAGVCTCRATDSSCSTSPRNRIASRCAYHRSSCGPQW